MALLVSAALDLAAPTNWFLDVAGSRTVSKNGHRTIKLHIEIWIFQTTMDGDMTKMKVVDLEKL
jgi:hypothetical protein